jgi:integrase
MPTKKLTDTVITKTKPPASGRLEFWDSLLPGFGLRITDNDARSYFVMYRADTPDGRKQRRLKIGDAKVIELAEARERARDALREVARGADPAEQRLPRKSATGDSVEAVATDYLERYVRKNTRESTHRETKRIFDVDVLPVWGHRAIGSITRRDVNELLDKIAGRGAEVQANRVLARLKTFFTWAADEEAIPASPIARMKPKTREKARDRVLTDEEIRWFWKGCDVIGWPFGPLFQLLLVTLQRRDEVGGIALSELDSDKNLWTIPRERSKNDRAHEVALSELAIDIIDAAKKLRPKIDEIKASTLLFTTNGKTAVSGFSRAKERLDDEIEHLARKDRHLPADDDACRKKLRLKAAEPLPRFMPEWILHDLRRTGATGMARLNIPPHVVDRVLNHVSGTIRGVAAVYNRFEYSPERKSALEAWGRYVTGLLRQPTSNVTNLGARRRA